MRHAERKQGPTAGRGVRRGAIARALTTMITVLVGSLLVLLLGGFVALQFAPVREALLAEAIPRANVHLPGELSVASHAWPRAGRLELRGLSWTADGETLVACERFELEVAWAALLARDLRLPVLRLSGLSLDLPRLRAQWDSAGASHGRAAAAAGDTAQAAGEWPWFAAGPLPGVPSLAIDSLEIQAPRMRLGPTRRVGQLVLVARIEARQAHDPSVAIETLRLALPDDSVTVSRGAVRIALGAQEQFAVELAGRLGRDWPFVVSGHGGAGDSLRLTAALRPQAPAPPLALRWRGRWQRTPHGLAGLRGAGLLRSDALARLAEVPLVGGVFAAAPRLDRFALRFTGQVAWQPQWVGAVRIDVEPGDWMHRGYAVVRFAPGELAADSVDVALADLELRARWNQRRGQQAGSLTLAVRGTQWLAPFASQAALPESLALDLAADLRGTLESPQLEAGLSGGARFGGLELERVAVRVAGRLTPATPLRFGLHAATPDVALHGSGALAMGDSLAVRLPRWSYRPRTSSGDSGTAVPDWARLGGTTHIDLPSAAELAAARGQLIIDPVRSRATLEAFALAGPWGEIEAAARFGDEGTQVTADLTFPRPAELLAGTLPAAEIEDWEGAAGAAYFRQADSEAEWTAGLELSAAPWLAAGRVRARGAPQRLQLETLQVELLDLCLTAAGAVRDTALSGSLQVDFTGGEWLRRLQPTWGDSLDATLQLMAQFGGTMAAPAARGTLGGSVRSRRLSIPRFDGRLALEPEGALAVALDLPRGVTGRGSGIDSGQVALRYASAAAGESASGQTRAGGGASLRGRVTAHRGPGRLEAAGDVALGPAGTTIALDSLSIGLADAHLEARQPVHLQLGPAPGALTLRDLELEGSLGSVHGSAALDSTGADIDLRAELEWPTPIAGVPIPPGLWPQRLQLAFAAHGRDSLGLTVRARGLQVASAAELDAEVSVHQARDGLRGSLRLGDEPRPLVRIEGRYPQRVRLDRLTLEPLPTPLRLHAELRDLPLPAVAASPLAAPGYLDRAGQPRAPRLNARAVLSGSPSAPALRLASEVVFSEYAELRDYQIDARAAGQWPPTAARDSAEAAPESGERWPARFESLFVAEAVPAAPAPGWALEVSAQKAGRRIFNGTLELSSAATRDTSGDAAATAGDATLDRLDVQLGAQGFPLADLTPLVPRVDRLGGKLDLDLRAAGALEDPSLDGHLELQEVQFGLRGGTRATAGGALALQGTLTAPRVDGEITIRNGRLVIPEAQKQLYPTRGEALLWAGSDTLRAIPRGDRPASAPAGEQRGTADSLAADLSAEGTGSKRQAVEPDAFGVDLTARIPAGVWLMGRGLEVELRGALHVLLRRGDVRLTGTLNAVRGGMEFQGRRLEVEKGTVTFYGERRPNPSLDITLSKQQADVTVRVHIHGTVERPRLSLSSEPAMSESDILSFLVFGRGAGGLDQEESERLEQRALATAEAFAAARLLARLEGQLGLDVLRYETASGDSLGRSVTVGKYLSPDLLVKYEQDLERESHLGVVIEYYLGGGFRLEMHSRRYEQDGAVLKWETDF